MILHWNGSKWSVESNFSAPNQSELAGIAAISANDIWTVGTFNGEQQTLTLHWDGTKWKTVFSPNSTSPSNQLTAVTAISSNDVWAVGFATANDGTPHPLTMHWDGHGWKIFPTPNPSPGSRLLGVDGAKSDDVWAVGGAGGFNGPPHAIIEHWKGRSGRWSRPPKRTALPVSL